MSSRARNIFNVLLLVLLVAYLVVAARYCAVREGALRCTELNIEIRDSARHRFVTPDHVRGWLADSALWPVGMPLNEIDVYAIERLVEMQDYVLQADVYAAIDGGLHVTLRQRYPLLRVVSEAGHNFYLDSTLVLLPPMPDCPAPVPVVSGCLPLAFPTDYFGPLDEKKFPRERELLYNLLNFVHQVDTDRFLTALASQIYYDRGEVYLLPRIGKQTVRCGEITDSATVTARLKKLSKFYQTTFGDQWWRQTSEVDLRFHGQVVCKGMSVPKPTDRRSRKDYREQTVQETSPADEDTNIETTHEIYGQ